MLTLYHHGSSACAAKVRFALEEKGLAWESRYVDLMQGEHRKPPYSTKNPNCLVPMLEDGDFLLTESSAILKYLAEKYGSPAYPRDLKARARINELMDWFNTGFYREYGYHLIYPQIFPNHKRPTDEAHRGTIDWGKTQAAPALAILDKHYLPGPGPYLMGAKEPSIADFFGTAIVTLGECIGVGLSAYPSIGWREANEMFEGFSASLAGKPFETLGAVAS